MNPDDCPRGANNGPALSLGSKDTDLLRELLMSARQTNIDGYGSHGQSAMATMICDFLGLGQEYRDVMFRAIDGDPLVIEVTSEVTI